MMSRNICGLLGALLAQFVGAIVPVCESGARTPSRGVNPWIETLSQGTLCRMREQYVWSVRWYGLIERAQLPKPTRPSLSHLHYTLRSPASRRASVRTC